MTYRGIVKAILKQSLKILYIFPIKHKKILLMSFDGSSYGFDSKAVAEYAIATYPGEYDLFWACKDLNRWENNCNLRAVKINSLHYLFTLATSEVIIYNINPPSFFPFRKKQLLCNTWHGFPYKKIGKYAPHFDENQFNTSTVFLSHSSWYTETIVRGSFKFNGTVLDSGVPRNDIFFSDKCLKAAEYVKKMYGIEEHVKVLLFAPTFRKDFSFSESSIDLELIIGQLSKCWGGDWVAMYRLHPMIASRMNIKQKNVIDVSSYPDMQELLCAADVLVSDYSSSMWDFSLMNKPVFAYVPDQEEYNDDRGLYIDCCEWPFCVARSNSEMVEQIVNFDKTTYTQKMNNYMIKMGSFENGSACEQLFDYIRKYNYN